MAKPETITSAANPLLKDVRLALARGAATNEGWCVAETFRLLEEALRSDCDVKTVLAAESTASRMTRLARAVMFGLPLYSLDEVLEKVEAVSVDDVTALCEELYDPSHLSAACIGRDEKDLRAAE